LLLLLFHITHEGFGWVDWQFLTSFPSRHAEMAGIKSALWGSVWMMILTASVAVPVGIATAVYLEEFAPKNRISTFIEINIANLAGVPSIIYGILGLAVFVRGISLGRCLLSGSLTMALLILPIIIISAREAIRTVPDSIRHAAYALGATKLQTVQHHVLPMALANIMTGVILALSRAMGEAAPLIMLGAFTYVAFVPSSPFDEFTVLPIQVFNWASRPQEAFHHVAAAGIIVLLVILVLTNLVALWIRFKKGARR
jgi:phosphate transport system permease protein